MQPSAVIRRLSVFDIAEGPLPHVMLPRSLRYLGAFARILYAHRLPRCLGSTGSFGKLWRLIMVRIPEDPKAGHVFGGTPTRTAYVRPWFWVLGNFMHCRWGLLGVLWGYAPPCQQKVARRITSKKASVLPNSSLPVLLISHREQKNSGAQHVLLCFLTCLQNLQLSLMACHRALWKREDFLNLPG